MNTKDVTVSDQGSVVMFILNTDKARTFVKKNVHTESWQWTGNTGFAVDHRYASDLLTGMQDNGLTVDNGTEAKQDPTTKYESLTGWKKKLFPGRFKGMSGKMAAIVGYICEETYTNPAISELVVTSDGFVMAQHVGDCGANDMLGSRLDLLRNWKNLLDAADLTPKERIEAEAAFERRIVEF